MPHVEPDEHPDHESRRARRIRLRINPSDLLLEIISIVIAIVLATAVGQLVDRVRTQRQTHEALVQLRREIATDDAVLRRRAPTHRRVWLAFRTVVQSARTPRMGFDTFTRTFASAAPSGFQPFEGTTTAWELARDAKVIDDVPYDLRATLQARYAEIAQLRNINIEVLHSFETAPTEDHPNFYFVAYAVALNAADIAFSEQRLIEDDRRALRALAQAGAM